MTTNFDITEGMPFDLSAVTPDTQFSIKDISFDLSIDNIPFVMNISNQNPYRRETAQYRKDQFDNSNEPGEQSLSGWWLRSQTSFHNGAGIEYYEPGTDAQHVTHRFKDSRGVNIWEEGQISLLKDVVHVYSGADDICSVTATNNSGFDYIITGDSQGHLHRVALDGDNNVTGDIEEYVLVGHDVDTHPFISVTSDGSNYYALCDNAVHWGSISDLNGDTIMYGNTDTIPQAFIKFAKGYLFGATGRNLYRADITHTSGHDAGGTGTFPTGTDVKTHINQDWIWNDIAGGPSALYASGYAGGTSEVWVIKFDDTTGLPNMSAATMGLQMPLGEVINIIEYYLGYLVIGTNKGVRIATVNANGDLVYGPLLFDGHAINGLVSNDRFVYAATSIETSNNKTNAILIRIDLSQPLDGGTFAYAYDLEYQSSTTDGDSSVATNVHLMDGRLVMVVEEGGVTGELIAESVSTYRSSGWLQTGKIRYGMIEPKYFRYINVTCSTGSGDSITVSTINQNNEEALLTSITVGLSNQDLLLESLYGKQEQIAFKFTLNNSSNDSDRPIVYGYQIKALPATKRQRLYQYPLSCYDNEMDRFGTQFGYDNRAVTVLQSLEAIEQTGRFVNVTDYRINETYQGVIEEVRFTNESSPDKNNSGFGGLLIVTIRKL